MSIAPLLPAQPASSNPEDLHPSIWRASQLARSAVRCVPTGHPSLTTNLPGGGWPTGSQIELLGTQPGIGEMRLMAPALRLAAQRKIVLVCPPHSPNILGLASMGLPHSALIWLRPGNTSDTLWATEQALRGGCGAVLLWANHARNESMRRLNLAAQSGGEALFFMLRPIAAAGDPSPAQLRLALRPANGGIEVTFVKRRGPQRDAPLIVPLPSYVPYRSPVAPNREDQRVIAPSARDLVTALS